MLDDSVVEARLEKECISGVEHFHVVVCPDHTGDDAVYIYIILPDPDIMDEEFTRKFRSIENIVFEICQVEYPGYWPYTRVRLVSEMGTCLTAIEARRQHAAFATMFRKRR